MKRHHLHSDGSLAPVTHWGEWDTPHLKAVPKVQAPEEPPSGDEQDKQNGLYLPEGFWHARPVLTHIRQAAESRMAGPDAVFGNCLARQGAYVHHGDTVDLRGKGFGVPLSIFAVLYGGPGAGKGESASCCQDLMPVPGHLVDFRERSIGSGEGLIEAYYGLETEYDDQGNPGKAKVRRQVRHNVLFRVDEGEALTKLISGRTGTTLAETIRSAWSGENIGQANASADRDRQLLRGQYSIGMQIGFQPSSIGPLFDQQQTGGGTPHRFLYFSALNPNTPDDEPAWPGPLDLPEMPHPWIATQYQLEDEAIREEIRNERRAALRGEATVSEQDKHATQMRGRVAAHLARWDGRIAVNAEDWHLAGMVMATSAAVRDSAIEHGRNEAAAEAQERKRTFVDRTVSAHQAVAAFEEQEQLKRVSRGAAVLARRVDKENGAVKHSDLRAAAGRYKKQFAGCLSYAIDAGWITRNGELGAGAEYVCGPNLAEVPDA